MSELDVPTIFESFNARALKPAQVARTFVPSLQYQRLTQRRHSVIVGPRGSGKTTLLKMLQPQALGAWNHPSAQYYRSLVDFTGVFIPTDRTWREQIRCLGNGRLDEESLSIFSEASVATHVLRSLIMTIAYRCSSFDQEGPVPFRRVALEEAEETHYASQLAEAWELTSCTPSLLGLKYALTNRLSRIQQLANQEAALPKEGRLNRLAAHRYLFLDFIQAATVATELFDDIIRETDARWALMFDELELAPDWLQAVLIAAMRSREDRFIFKLALAPFSGGLPIMQDALSPAPDQDFDPICLWYAEKRTSYSFCSDLWFQILAERGLPRIDPKDALGRSQFETPSEEWKDGGSAYGATKRLGKTILNAAHADTSFREYLANNKLDPLRLDNLSGDERAATIRKITPVLIVRDFFRRERKSGKTVRRSRKRASLYTGADSLFAISEGNPRWFISMIGRLLDHWDERSASVPAPIQAEEMVHAAQRFGAMLGTIPSQDLKVVGPRGILGLVEKIANYFHRRVVDGPFMAEPPSTFIVDDKVPLAIITALGQALNAGALVYVPDDWSRLILDDLRGKRFRISYLLAPLYGLPIRLGKEISLTTILDSEKVTSIGEQLRLS